MESDEIDIQSLPFLERIELYIVVFLAAIKMTWQMYKEYKWERKIDSVVIPPKVKPEDRVYKYN